MLKDTDVLRMRSKHGPHVPSSSTTLYSKGKYEVKITLKMFVVYIYMICINFVASKCFLSNVSTVTHLLCVACRFLKRYQFVSYHRIQKSQDKMSVCIAKLKLLLLRFIFLFCQ